MDTSEHRALWERRQAELWERIFQLAQDVVQVADSFHEESGGAVIKKELVISSMNIGKYLVRATASDSEKEFMYNVEEARMQAIEADYWLRLAYIIGQKEEVQRDVSNIIAQLAAVIEMLQKMTHHLESKHDATSHMRGPKVAL